MKNDIVRPIVLAAALLAGAGSARAQDSTLTGPCDGRPVSSIDVETGRPAFSGAEAYWRRLARKFGLHHATTRSPVVRRFVTLSPGQACTQLRLHESERILRAQPYLAAASVRAVADSGGAVRVEVHTTDDVPVVLGGRLSHGRLSGLLVGNDNLFGRAISLSLGGERRAGYRNGGEIGFTSWQTFGRPYVFSAFARHAPLGGALRAEMEHPYMTDLQRIAWHLSGDEETQYPGLRRPDRQAGVALPTDLRVVDAGAVFRVGGQSRVLLLGGRGVRVTRLPRAIPIAITDSGAVPDSASPLIGRFAPDRVTWAIGEVGARAVRYTTVRGLDALTAAQDVPRGAQLVARLGRGVPVGGTTSHDVLTAADFSGGWANQASILRVNASAEMRRLADSAEWAGAVGSGRAEWALKPSEATTFTLGADAAGMWRPLIPAQLALDDNEGGVRGLSGGYAVGARRAVGRLEGRRLVGSYGTSHRADLGVAAFVDAGKVWAGGAPFGITSGVAAGAGVSFLAALPAGSKRLLRVDVAYPFRTGTPDGRRRLSLGFSFDDPTRGFFDEPADVARARNLAGRGSITDW